MRRNLFETLCLFCGYIVIVAAFIAAILTYNVLVGHQPFP